MKDPLQQKLVEALDRRAQDLDGATLSRLRRARAEALQLASTRRSWLPGGWRLAGAGLALGLLVVALLPGLRQAAPPQPTSGDELLEIATLDVELEVVEDLEFYEWLTEQGLGEADDEGPA